jgi:hypothetical protein
MSMPLELDHFTKLPPDQPRPGDLRSVLNSSQCPFFGNMAAVTQNLNGHRRSITLSLVVHLDFRFCGIRRRKKSLQRESINNEMTTKRKEK